jgi:pimeloyl-ACP methyl ester carboxylesterase
MTLQKWFDSGQFLKVNGNNVFYTHSGEGVPVVFIHGFPTSSWDWYKVWQQLTPNFHCITFDMLGFGFSDKPLQTYTIAEQADIVCAVLAQLNIASCHIVSHDYGDTVAQELLARRLEGALPFAIRSVSLLNGGLFPETHRPLLTQKILLSPLGKLAVRLIKKRSIAKNFKHIFGPETPPSDTEVDQMWTAITHNNGHLVMHKLIAYMTERRNNRTRWVGALQQTDMPLVLINGLADPISGEHLVARFEQLVPQGEVVRLPEIGHYPQLEDADAVTDALYTMFNG